MDYIRSCCGRERLRLPDEEALLPVYEDDTSLQRRLHAKMHTYQMLRAMGQGFMPSNEQAIIQLKTIQSSDILKPENHALSPQGRRLIDLCKRWLGDLITLLAKKNDGDQVQDFIWLLAKSKVDFDTTAFAEHAQSHHSRIEMANLFESLKTVSELLFSNSDFRLFLDDLLLLGRQVLADSARSLSTTSSAVAESIEPSVAEASSLTGPGKDDARPPDQAELKEETKAVGQVVKDALAQTGGNTLSSVRRNFSGEAKDTILARLKIAVQKLRKRPDYENAVNIISVIVKHYIAKYTAPVENAVNGLQSNLSSNDAFDEAMTNFWSLLKSFGNHEEWEALEQRIENFLRHAGKNPQFENLVTDVGRMAQDMFLEPDFFDHIDEKSSELTAQSQVVSSVPGSIRNDADSLMLQVRRTWQSVLHDKEIHQVLQTSMQLLSIVIPDQGMVNQQLLQDALNFFFPLLVGAIQHIPIPRLELSTPEIDLLLENLVLQPGQTVNHSSFLPYRLRVESVNNVEIRKARFRMHSSLTSLITIKLDGITIRADDVGYWLRSRMGFAQFTDEGIASFHLDQRGMDIHIDVEVCRERTEQILTLHDVRVKIHHLDYSLSRSKVSWLAWIVKPLLRPILRRTMEKELSNVIGDLLHAANRELLFARERLRATRIAEPSSILKFMKAVAARLVPEEDPDVFTAVGVRPSNNPIFRGRYAPGSVVKLWEQEVADALYKVEDGQLRGWRNEIFDVQTVLEN